MARVAVLDRPGADARPETGGNSRRPTAPPPSTGILLLVLVMASAITALGLRAHAMWFDELQAWNVARASHSIGDLYTNLRYEGHPILWYLPLYALTRITGNPHTMQVLQWLVATATFALVLFRAPFTLPFRVAVIAGYCFAFEYGVISRSYGLGALLVVAALVLIARPQPAWRSAGIVLALLAWTSLPSAALAIAIAVTVVWVYHRHLVFAGSVLLAAGASAFTCIPPSDFSSFAPGLAGSSSKFGSGAPVHVASALAGTWRGLVPIPASVGEWNSNLLDGFPGAVWIEAALAMAVFVVVLKVLRPFAFARSLWWIGSAGFVVFFVVVMLPEQARYAGFPFLLFLACAWFAFSPPGVPAPRPLDTRGADREPIVAVMLFVLAAQVVATVAILPIASTEPFSRDRDLAALVEDAGLERTIVSGQDWDGVTVGGYLDRPVYSVVRGAWIRYFIHDEREARHFNDLTDKDIVCSAAILADTKQHPVALIVDHRLRGETLVGVSEEAAVYRVDPGTVSAGC